MTHYVSLNRYTLFQITSDWPTSNSFDTRGLSKASSHTSWICVRFQMGSIFGLVRVLGFSYRTPTPFWPAGEAFALSDAERWCQTLTVASIQHGKKWSLHTVGDLLELPNIQPQRTATFSLLRESTGKRLLILKRRCCQNNHEGSDGILQYL